MEIIYIYKLSKVKWAMLASSSPATIMNYWISHLFFIVIDIINIFAWKHPQLHSHRNIYEPVPCTALCYRALSAEGKCRQRRSHLWHWFLSYLASTGPRLHRQRREIKINKTVQGAESVPHFLFFLQPILGPLVKFNPANWNNVFWKCGAV